LLPANEAGVLAIEQLDPAGHGVAEQLLALQRAAYRVEADLIGFDGIPPLHESLKELQAQPLEWIGLRADSRIVAALAYRVERDLCDIDRLVVDPRYFGRGYGSALVASLLHHPQITVSTGTANTPARRLYEKHGFQATGTREIAHGVTVTQYERRMPCSKRETH
jgi:ribosomal protein S18 acetylase RimI-like enzyme